MTNPPPLSATGDVVEGGSLFSRLHTGTGAFDIVGSRRRWYLAFGLLVAICLVAMAVQGFRLGIEFTGGTQIQVPVSASAPVAPEQVRTVFEQAAGVPAATVQTVGSGASESVLVRSQALAPQQLGAVRQALSDAVAPPGTGGASTISDSAVSAGWGTQITHRAVVALLVFLVLVALFLTVAFERWMAVAALVALTHDIVVTAGVYAIVGFEVTPATIVGLLTILGFSLYDTVGFGVLGVGVLGDLALVQMVGIVAGVVSSLLIATPVLVDLKMREPRFAAHARRVHAGRTAPT